MSEVTELTLMLIINGISKNNEQNTEKTLVIGETE